jgi:hypothetical protein
MSKSKQVQVVDSNGDDMTYAASNWGVNADGSLSVLAGKAGWEIALYAAGSWSQVTLVAAKPKAASGTVVSVQGDVHRWQDDSTIVRAFQSGGAL